jgi:2-polyprenyl-3-methyl-5-hydroxy-6-metoxy-1,4-benzoquinol methylase
VSRKPSKEELRRKLGDRTPGRPPSGLAERLATERVDRCPLCGARGLSPERRFPDPLFPGGELVLARCLRCGLVALTPRLTEDSIEAVEEENTFYAYDEPPDEELIGFLEHFLEVLEGFLPRKGRLLDIGCARGYLLEAARRRGWDAVGTEISPAAVERARRDFGARVYASLEEVAASEEPFDAAIAWHVLEHTVDPVGFLRAATKLLHPGGAFALQVPSYGHLDEFERRGERVKLVCSVHTLYFEEASLRRTLARAGLEPLWFDSSDEELFLTAVSVPAVRPRELPVELGGRLAPERVDRCPLCGGGELGPDRGFADPLFPGGELSLARCGRCGLVMLTPRLTGESAALLEEERAFHDHGGGGPPDEEQIGTLESFLEGLEGLLPRKGRLLDLGCARGYLLEAARRRGWEAVGTERAAPGAELARRDFGARVYGSLEEVAAAEEPFDAVIVRHVLERAVDPVGFLRAAAKVLHRRGALAAQVHDYGRLDEFERRGEREKLVRSAHTLYFEEDTLRRTLADAGLESLWLGSSAVEHVLTAVCARRRLVPPWARRLARRVVPASSATT